MRSGLIVIGALSLVLASCATIPTPQEANDAVLALRKYESRAWALGIALIWADLVLPVPQTAVIAALGIIYGTLLGGLLGSLGLITGGLLGYVLMLISARRFVQRDRRTSRLTTEHSQETTMARAYGSSAHLLMKRETAYGQAATGNYIRMPFNRCNLGSGQGPIDDRPLDQGRDPLPPRPRRVCSTHCVPARVGAN